METRTGYGSGVLEYFSVDIRREKYNFQTLFTRVIDITKVFNFHVRVFENSFVQLSAAISAAGFVTRYLLRSANMATKWIRASRFRLFFHTDVLSVTSRHFLRRGITTTSCIDGKSFGKRLRLSLYVNSHLSPIGVQLDHQFGKSLHTGKRQHTSV